MQRNMAGTVGIDGNIGDDALGVERRMQQLGRQPLQLVPLRQASIIVEIYGGGVWTSCFSSSLRIKNPPGGGLLSALVAWWHCVSRWQSSTR